MATDPTTTTKPKRSWPLLLVAGCAFIPGLGFLFASVGLTWGLLSDRPRAMLAAVLAGAGGLLNLLGGVVLIWHVQDDPTSLARRASSARRDLARVVAALETYREAHGQYPQSLVVFTQLPLSLKLVNVSDISTPGFPIPRLYTYRRSEDGRWYDVYGVGADGRPGTEDDVRPELPDSVARRSGYRPPR